MVVSRLLLPFRLLLMLTSQKALSPTFQLLLLPLSADLFRLYLTSPVLVDTSFNVFTDLFPPVSHCIGLYQRFGVLLFFTGYFGFFSQLCSTIGRVSTRRVFLCTGVVSSKLAQPLISKEKTAEL